MDSRWGMLALTTGATSQPFASLSLKDREAVIQSWFNSPIASKRLVAKVLKAVILSTFYGITDENKSNTFQEMTGYPGLNQKSVPSDLFELPVITMDQLTQDEFDVIIVGTGCGGGPTAEAVAKAGLSCLVLDKGPYCRASDLGWDEATGTAMIYEKAGLLGSDDASISILAASCVGGGSFINWAACLRLQNYVKEEWGKKYGMDFVLTDEYNEDQQYVFDFMGVNTDKINHSPFNKNLMKGCERLGMHVAEIGQNSGNKEHDCTHCHFGCPSQTKQSTTVSWLKDAVENGATVVEKAHVTKVVIQGGKAVGVEVLVNGSPRVIKAKQVCVSAGSLWTPVVLQNSGLTNRHIGANLRLHPATIVAALMPEHVGGWQGPILSTVTNAYENITGDGYGVKIECPTFVPGLMGGVLPWVSAEQHKKLMANFANISAMVLFSRDKDSVGTSQTTKLPNGEYYPKINFALSPTDNKSLTEGTIGAAKILLAAGALEVYVCMQGIAPYRRPKDGDNLAYLKDPAFDRWMAAVRRHGYSLHSSTVATAHQMGSCRMGKNPSMGAVQFTGETWEVKNLWYVAHLPLFNL
jgi:choline dehydrogenase-like flavoprotein